MITCGLGIRKLLYQQIALCVPYFWISCHEVAVVIMGRIYILWNKNNNCRFSYIYIYIYIYIHIYKHILYIYIYTIYIYIYVYIYLVGWWVKLSIYIYFKGSEQSPESIILSGILVNFTISVLPEFSFLLIN